MEPSEVNIYKQILSYSLAGVPSLYTHEELTRMSSDPHAHVDLVLHPGQVMTFRADLMHAGLAQSSDPEANVRMHFYHHAANIIHKGQSNNV